MNGEVTLGRKIKQFKLNGMSKVKIIFQHAWKSRLRHHGLDILKFSGIKPSSAT